MTTKLKEAILALSKTQKVYDEAVMNIIVKIETENRELKEMVIRQGHMIDTIHDSAHLS